MDRGRGTVLHFLRQPGALRPAGGEAGELVRALAFQNLRPSYPKTMGGKVWWRFVETLGPYTIQQNLLSQHYRALDPEDGRVFSSFDLEEIRQQLRDFEGTS